MLLFFNDAQAFSHLSPAQLKKGGRMVEYMCLSNGKALSEATAAVINRARNDCLDSEYSGVNFENPYPEGSTAFNLYASVAKQTLLEDRSPYPPLPDLYGGFVRH